MSRFSAGHPVPDPDEGTPEGDTYPTRSRPTTLVEALEQGELSRQGLRVGDPLSRDLLNRVEVHGLRLPTDDVRASAVPSRARGWTRIYGNGVQANLAAAARPTGGALDIPGT
jgi:hypothetical protein